MTQFQDHTTPLDRETAARIKGMLARGDALEDIAVWFGLSAHIVRSVQAGAVHPFLAPAPASALPPAGPYQRASQAYRALEEVHAAERRLFNMALNAANILRSRT